MNPLLAIEVAGSGHIDILGALLLVISAAALARKWRMIAALTFGSREEIRPVLPRSDSTKYRKDGERTSVTDVRGLRPG